MDEVATATGRPLGRPCTLCSHRERLAIEQAIGDGKTFRSIAARFDVNRSSIRRHIVNHMDLDDATSASVGLDAVSLAIRVHDVAERARDAATDALDRGDTSGAIRSGDAELRALSALAALGIRHESMIERLDASRAVLNAAGRLARRDPVSAEALAAELERGDRSALANGLREQFINQVEGAQG